mgnify:CR=1 FL=1
MSENSILILKGGEINRILNGRESEVVDQVGMAYRFHGKGDSSCPHSLFLRFPNSARNRIITLPAYLGGDFQATGMKWVASFPENLNQGLPRASAVIILNSSETGRPKIVMEGSIVSAVRTAASAALAGYVLQDGKRTERAGFIGTGLINFQILRFLRVKFPELSSIAVFDTDVNRSEEFKARCEQAHENLAVDVVTSASDLLAYSSLTSIATSAIEPHISDLSPCEPKSTILHVSLRDFTPEVILASDNLVDDLDHVNRERTSIHLASLKSGNADFVRGSLADILEGAIPARTDDDRVAIFSPFGLGVLDMAVAHFVSDFAAKNGIGTVIEDFLALS